ncbi:MAG: LysM peptidoglycan-binding domain-containing protein [Bdellovibrionota bacterium]
MMTKMKHLFLLLLVLVMSPRLSMAQDSDETFSASDEFSQESQSEDQEEDMNSQESAESSQAGTLQGARPEVYIIQPGDTLWDVCSNLLANPYYWPKLWSFNPYIKNPHLIYPGDQLVFRPGTATSFPSFEVVGAGKQIQPQPVEIDQPSQVVETQGARSQLDTDFIVDDSLTRVGDGISVKLKTLAFVDQDNLKAVGSITHSGEPKTQLSYGDRVYIEVPGKEVQKGDKFHVIERVKRVTHPAKELKKIGWMIRKKGVITVDRVIPKNKFWGKRVIEGTISDSHDTFIQRNDELIPYENPIVSVIPHFTDREIDAYILEGSNEQFLISNNDFVFLDVGKNQGVDDGLQLFVARKGDGLFQEDDKHLPYVPVAKLLVIKAGKNTSTAYVTTLDRALEVGDRVFSRLR